MCADRTLINLRHRLERWELDHLRAPAAAQAEEIERLQDELNWANQAADTAAHTADVYRSMLDEPGTYKPGLTKDSQVGLVLVGAH